MRGSSKDSGCFRQRKVPPLRSRQTGCIGRRGYAKRMVVNVFNFLSSLQCENIFDPTCNEIQGRDQRRSAFLFSTSQDGRTEQCRIGPGHILNIRILKELLRNFALSTISPWRENNLKSMVFRRIWEIGAAPLDQGLSFYQSRIVQNGSIMPQTGTRTSTSGPQEVATLFCCLDQNISSSLGCLHCAFQVWS